MIPATAGPTGGRYTIWNRLVCFLVGHVDPPEVTAETTVFDIYLCCRCNGCAHLVGRVTGIRYRDIEQYLDERRP